MVQERPVQILFDKILIVDFLSALKDDAPERIDVSRNEFESMAREYTKDHTKKKTAVEKRVEMFQDRIYLVKACLFYLSERIGDQEIMDILTEHGFEIRRDTYFQDLKTIADKIEVEEMKLETAKSKIPDKPKKNKKSSENFNTFDVLTSVATGLELSLDFSKMVINEFISYRTQLQRKTDRIEKSMKQAKKKK